MGIPVNLRPPLQMPESDSVVMEVGISPEKKDREAFKINKWGEDPAHSENYAMGRGGYDAATDYN